MTARCFPDLRGTGLWDYEYDSPFWHFWCSYQWAPRGEERSRWHPCTKQHVGGCRGQVGWRRATEQGGYVPWQYRPVPIATESWRAFNAWMKKQYPSGCA